MYLFLIIQSMLGSDDQHSVSPFIAIESCRCRILQDSNILHLFRCNIRDLTFYTIDNDQRMAARTLDTTDIIRRGSTSKTGRFLKGLQAEDLTEQVLADILRRTLINVCAPRPGHTSGGLTLREDLTGAIVYRPRRIAKLHYYGLISRNLYHFLTLVRRFHL